MSVNQRGCLTLLGALVFGVIFCFLIPFVVLPNLNAAVTLPIITVPGEYFVEDWPSPDLTLTNTVIGMLVSDLIVIIIALVVRGHSQNWTKEVPGRFQGAVEVLTSGLWGLTKDQAGTKPKVRNILFPIVATLFVFLLAANWGKLVPGVESVGFIHCIGKEHQFNAFPRDPAILGGYQLRNEAPINSGTMTTNDDYKVCNSFKQPNSETYSKYLPRELDPFMDQAVVYTTVEGDTLESVVNSFNAQAEEQLGEPIPEDMGVELASGEPQYTGWRTVDFSMEEVLALNPNLEFEGEEGAEAGEPVLVPGQQVTLREELIGAEASTRDNQLYHVTPWVRGAATDLNLTLGLALMSFVLIQAFGISELGLNYFQKFVNVHAIGTLGQRPLGAIDFIAGLFEIVSEIGKIISLSFRLFGAIFAGGLLYAVFLFLFGTTIPVVILLLEVIVGAAQAGVFAILTLIFSAQAMVSHHGDDHDHGHEAHEAH